MTTPKQINARGFGHGWHADMLKSAATTHGKTMAEAFIAILNGSPLTAIEEFPIQQAAQAFNVPATCTKVVGRKAYYEFRDGSTATFLLPKKK